MINMRLFNLVILLTALCSFSCFADIQIQNPRARATFALAQTGALYVSLVNDTNYSDTLISVSVPDAVAETAQLHEVITVGDMMRMQQISDGIIIKGNSSVELSPGGMHIMLLGLKQPLIEGDNIEITLSFANADAKVVTVPVVKL